MPFAAALSTLSDTREALRDVCHKLTATSIPRPSLALVFFSNHHGSQAAAIVETLQQTFQPQALLGCLGESIVGNELEIENQPGLSVWLGHWSEIEIEPFHLYLERTSEGFSVLGWPDGTVSADPATSAIVLLGDPYSFPVDRFLARVNQDCPGLRVVGGMASGMVGRGQTQLIQSGQVRSEGAVGVLLQNLRGLRTVVSQGCRPIGRHMIVTRAAEDIIFELGGRSPMVVLQELWPTLSTRDQELFQNGLHIGRVLSEYQGEFRRGDFLVRNVRHLDRQTGALVITDHLRVGQTVQFHVRDAETADEDLHLLLRQDLEQHPTRPTGGLLFSCNGRGSRLFAEPHHDAATIQQEMGPIPLAGFFAAGELGPVGGQNFIHGFTASVVLFES